MPRKILVRPPIIRLHKPTRCIVFLASTDLLTLLVVQGFPVRTHPLRSNQLVLPEKSLSHSQLLELLQHPDFVYVASASFLTSPTGSNQTFNKPSDWNDDSNSIELIGAGGGGGSANRTGNVATGGGGGEYGKTTQFTFTGSSATYRIGTGGAGVTPTAGSTVNTNGTAGGDSWWNGTTQAGSTLGGIGGGLGQAGSGAAGLNGGAGGTGGVGTTHNAGGRGGNYTGTTAAASTATSGGGAGGDTGTGGNGADTASSNTAVGPGGSGGNTGGGSGGAASTTNGVAGGTGNNGTNFDPTHGAGGGGGGGRWAANSAQNAGPGGNYGAGGGAAVNNGSGGGGSTQAISKAGASGIIDVEWASLAMQFYRTYNDNLIPQIFLMKAYQ